MKNLIFILCILIHNLAFAEKNKSELQPLPNVLKGIEWNGKVIRHGYIQWLEKKPYTPLVNPILAKQGAEIYTKHCLQCHGVTGQGDGPVAKQYGVKASNISDSNKVLSNHTLFVQVAEGRGDMPQWMDVLTEKEIWVLTHYLHTLKQ